MALVVKDRVKQTTTTTGTGSVVLNGTVDSFQTFTSALANGDTTYYAIVEPSTNSWEVGLGTWTESTATLARTTILESSNAGSAINLTAGEAEVFITYPAEKSVYLDANGNINATGNVDVAGTLDVTGAATFDDSVTIQGDLTVNGTTTTVNATNLAVADNMIYLNDGSTTTNPDLGWAGNYNDGTYAHAGVFRDASDATFKFYDGYTPEPGIAIDTTHASFSLADVDTGNLDVTGNISVSGTVDGRDVASDGSKLDGIEAGATGDQTPSEILTAVKTVDGSGSGLDADLLDGQQGSYYLDWTHVTNKPDPSVTLSGDVSGSATMTDLGSINITTTVANDSHTHDGRYYTETEVGNFFAGTTAITGYNKTNWDTTYGWGNHASAGYLAASSYTASDVLTKIKTVDGSGSGLDADLLDGLNSSQFVRSDTADSITGKLTFPDGSNSPSFKEFRFTNASGMRVFQTYVADSYFVAGEYQKLIRVTPSASSRNWQLVGRIIANSGAATQTLYINSVLRSNTLPDLDWTNAYNEELSTASSRYITPYLWTDETNGDFILVVKVEAQIYGNITMELDVIERIDGDLANVTVYREPIIEQTTVDAGYSENSFVRLTSITTTGLDVTGNITVSGTVDGRDVAADGAKLDGIEAGATADQTASEILTAIKTVDGSGSGLDADLLDGTQLSAITRSGSSVALTGAVTGSTTVAADGSISISTTATSDPTLTLAGDATGSATFTNLGNATLTVTVVDDSHNHIISNVDGLQTALDGKLGVSAKAADSELLDGLNSSDFVRYSAGGTLSNALADNAWVTNYGGTTNVDHIWHDDAANAWNFNSDSSFKGAANSRVNAGSFYANNNVVWHAGNDGAGSGLDADTVDGLQASQFLRSDTSDTMSGTLTLTGTVDHTGIYNGIYHGIVEDRYYSDDYNGARNLSAFLETQRSDIIRYRPVSNLEYWDGSAWQDGSSQLSNLKKLLDGRKDTMWQVPSTYYKFRFTVTANTSWPLRALIGLETSWTGSTYQGCQMIVEELQADSSWATKVTADFTSSNGVTDWGTMFRADSALHTGRGSQANATRITIDFSDWTPSNPSYVTVPLQNIFVLSNHAGTENNDYKSLLDYDQNLNAPANITVSGTVDGRDVAADGAKLDGIEAGATADQTKADIDALGINADQVDGLHAASFLRSDTSDTFSSGTLTFSSGTRLTGGLSSPVDGFFMPQNPEGKHIKSPFFFNDIAYARLRGATVSVDVDGTPMTSTSAIDDMLNANTDFWNLSTTGVTTVTITITNLPKALTYGSYTGVTFGNSNWRAKNATLQYSTDNGSTWSTAASYTNQTEEFLVASFSTGGTGTNALKWTFSNFNSTSMRIVSLFAYNYNASGMEGLYVTRDGGDLYGEINVNGNTVWHQGNDGSGSGLDADLLDGQQGSYYLDWTNVTNKPDPVITLAGDATGSVTLTDLGSGTLTVTVVDDSHNHVISNVDGLQTALDGKLNLSGGTLTGTLNMGANNITMSNSNITGVNSITINDPGEGIIFTGTNNVQLYAIDDANDNIMNFSGAAELRRNNNKVWDAGNDGSGSGLDADLLDGQQGSYYAQKAYWPDVDTNTGDTHNPLLTFSSVSDYSKPSGYMAMIRSTSTALPSNHGESYFGYTVTSKRDTGGGYSALLTGYGGNNLWFTYTNTSSDTPSWKKVWHDGNDGAGSGLDADLWDGNQFSSYLNQAVLTSSSPTFANAYIADNVIHSGDTDTYIGFHAADQWRVVTGGTERFEINNSDVTVQSALKEKYVALSGTTPSIDVDAGGAFSLTTSGNTTFTFTAFTSGISCGFILQLTSGGAHTITWPASVDWASGTAPDAPASGETDIYVFWSRDGGTTWYGVQSIDAAA